MTAFMVHFYRVVIPIAIICGNKWEQFKHVPVRSERNKMEEMISLSSLNFGDVLGITPFQGGMKSPNLTSRSITSF